MEVVDGADAGNDVPVSAVLSGRDAVAAWMASGLAMREFSEQARISFWSLKRWRLEFGEELGLKIRRRPGAASKRTKPDGLQSAAVVRSKVRLAPVMLHESVTANAGLSQVEVALRGGRCVKVDSSVDLQWLSRLLVLVEQAS